jgi:hypothetical protein
LIFVYAAFKIHPFNVNQVVMIVLALLTLVVGHAIHLWIINEWLDVAMQTLAFVSVFCLPVYVFKLEPESIGYVQKGLIFINQKAFKRSK